MFTGLSAGTTFVDCIGYPGSNIPVHVTGVEFTESYPSSGFDGLSQPHWLMVPLGENNTAVAAINPAPAVSKIGFSMQPGASKASVTPATAASANQTITLTGLAVGDTTHAEARLNGGPASLADLHVSVLSRRTRKVAIHAVTQEYTKAVPLAPGQGKPRQVCVRARGPISGTVPQGDDEPVGLTITTGPKGVCQTPADPSTDDQVIPVGEGIPHDIPPSNVPSAAAVKEYLNKVFGVQTNTYYDVPPATIFRWIMT